MLAVQAGFRGPGEMQNRMEKSKLTRSLSQLHVKKFKLHCAVGSRGRPTTTAAWEMSNLSDSDSGLSGEESKEVNQNKVKQIKRRGKTQKRSQVKNAKWGEKEERNQEN